MARFDGSGIKIVYTYAPETLISAGDFDALRKAKQEIDAAWAALRAVDDGLLANKFQCLPDAINKLRELRDAWRQNYETRTGELEAELQAVRAYTPPYEALMRELADTKRQLAQAETALANEHEKVASLREDKAYFVEATKKARAELEAERQKCKQLQGEKIYLARAADDAEKQNKIVYQERAKLQGEIASLTRERDALLEANDYNIRCAGNLNTHVIALEVEKQRLEKQRAEQKDVIAAMSHSNDEWWRLNRTLEAEKQRLQKERDTEHLRAINGAKLIAEYSDKCAKLELRSNKLNARVGRMRGQLFKIEETCESIAKLHSLAYNAICDDDELAKEQERVCGAS